MTWTWTAYKLCSAAAAWRGATPGARACATAASRRCCQAEYLSCSACSALGASSGPAEPADSRPAAPSPPAEPASDGCLAGGAGGAPPGGAPGGGAAPGGAGPAHARSPLQGAALMGVAALREPPSYGMFARPWCELRGGGSSIGLSGARRARRCSPPAGGKPLLLNLWRLFGDVSRSAQPIPGMSTHRGRGRSRGASACAPKPAAVRGMRAKSSYTRTCAGSRCPPRGCSDSGSARGKRAAPLTTAASKNGCPAALALARACARENALARAHATSSSFFASHGRRAASASASAGELASASVSGARVEPAAQRLASARGCPRLPGPTARGRAGCFYAGAGGAGAAAGAPGRRAAGARRSRGWPCRSQPSR